MAAFPAPDGTQLAAIYYPPLMSTQAAAAGKTAPGILLLHMAGRTHANWDMVARTLQMQGYAVLAPDLRGHGASGGTADWSQMPGDARAAWAFLVSQRAVNGQRSAIMGASIGANLALIVGANNPAVATVIALSPGLNYHGLTPAELLPNFGQRPILLVASQDDEYAYTSVQALAPRTPAAQTHYLTTAGHGTEMFKDPDLEPLILEWLQRFLSEMKG